jgi:hypothetical protein
VRRGIIAATTPFTRSETFLGPNLATKWTQTLNQGGATDSLSFDDPNGLIWGQEASTVSLGISRITQTISGSAWQFILHIKGQTISDPTTSNTNWAGFYLGNTGLNRQYYIALNKFDGLFYVFGARFSGHGYVSTGVAQAAGISSIPNDYYFRATLASGVITFARSLNGSSWTNLGTESLSGFLLAIDTIGIAVVVNANGISNSTTIPAFTRVY